MTHLSRGLFICDGCDTACDHAKELVLRPQADRLKGLPEGTKVAVVHMAFCARCMNNREVTNPVIQKAAEELNEWVQKQTK